MHASAHRIKAYYYLTLLGPFGIKRDVFLKHHAREVEARSVLLFPAGEEILRLGRRCGTGYFAAEIKRLRSNRRAALRIKGHRVLIYLPLYVYYRICLDRCGKIKFRKKLGIHIPARKRIAAKHRICRLSKHAAVYYGFGISRISLEVRGEGNGRIELFPFSVNRYVRLYFGTREVEFGIKVYIRVPSDKGISISRGSLRLSCSQAVSYGLRLHSVSALGIEGYRIFVLLVLRINCNVIENLCACIKCIKQRIGSIVAYEGVSVDSWCFNLI